MRYIFPGESNRLPSSASPVRLRMTAAGIILFPIFLYMMVCWETHDWAQRLFFLAFCEVWAVGLAMDLVEGEWKTRRRGRNRADHPTAYWLGVAGGFIAYLGIVWMLLLHDFVNGY